MQKVFPGHSQVVDLSDLSKIFNAGSLGPNEEVSALIDRCDGVFRKIVLEFCKLKESFSLSASDEACMLGRFTKFLREMDDVVSDRLGYPLHRYCCCHVKERGVQHPQDQLKSTWLMLQNRPIRWVECPESTRLDGALTHRSVTSFSWQFGGGHRVVEDRCGNLVAAEGGHVYKVDADEEVLLKFDFVYSLSQRRFSSIDVLNFLMRHNLWFVLRFINWMFGTEDAAARQLKADEFLLSLEKRGRTDLVISCFDRYLSAIETSAYQAERPILSVATDFDPEVHGIERPEDVSNPDFLRSVMIPLEDELARELNKNLSPNQIRFGGLPVRGAFLKKYSEDELAALRQNYRVDPDAQVVVLVAGGQGVQNGYAKLLKEHYEKNQNPGAGNLLPKIHLFVVTGKNQRQKDRLDVTFKDFGHPQLKVNILGWLEEEPMGELAAMAAQPIGPSGYRGVLVSAKGGGGTLSDAVAAGAPLVVCDRTPISWEQGNIQYVCRTGLGRRFVTKQEFVPTLLNQLNSPYEPQIDYRGIDSAKNLVDMMKELVERSEARREKVREQVEYN